MLLAYFDSEPMLTEEYLCYLTQISSFAHSATSKQIIFMYKKNI